MTQYILLIQNNAKSIPSAKEWEDFFETAHESGLFEGGSEIGSRSIVGDAQSSESTDHIVGYMRFDSGDRQKICNLVEKHPVVIHGGTVELCELPKS